MPTNAILEDTALASLISSKICHDLAGQIGAINNGLELLEEENDEDTRYYALELIQNSAKAAWAQLDFNRLAFGVASSLGAVVPLAHVEQVARRYIENGKRRLHWQANVQDLEKDQAKLLLALLAVALTALPAGGDFYVGLSVTKAKDRALASNCSFCAGDGRRVCLKASRMCSPGKIRGPLMAGSLSPITLRGLLRTLHSSSLRSRKARTCFSLWNRSNRGFVSFD